MLQDLTDKNAPITRVSHDHLSLRTKLFIGFGGMVAILMAIGGLSLQALNEFGEMFDSVIAQENTRIKSIYEFRQSVRTLDRDFLESTYSSEVWDAPHERLALAKTEAALDKAITGLNPNANGNEEEAAVQTLVDEWEVWVASVGDLIDQQRTVAERQIFYETDIQEKTQSLVGKINSFAESSHRSLIAGRSGVQGRAVGIRYAMVVLVTSGTALGGIFLFIVGRFILQPISALTESVTRAKNGDLDINVQISTNDELGQLAAGVNEMAARLREFRRIDQEKILRVSRTTQLAVDSLRDAVALFDAKANVEVSNETARRLFGLEAGKTIGEIGKDWLFGLFNRARAEREPIYPRGYETTIQVFEGGRELFFLPNAVPIFDDAGALQGVTIVLADVTLLRRLDELKSSMIATVSHELKTPLTSIRMALYILLERGFGELNDNQVDLLTTANGDCERLFNTLENLLDLSRLQAGARRLDQALTSPAALIEEVAAPLRARFREAEIELAVDIEEGLPEVVVDSRLIGVALGNLLSNALKYCRAGDRVIVSARTGPRNFSEIVVADTGSGIPSEYTEKVFDKFFRMPGSAKNGAGLGLAIAREIVEAHHGMITCESELGKGATFKISLPTETAATFS
ncbi:hypothetical protein BH09SUM1_BH09SUM1_24940 [soil metagenome]